MSENHYMIPKYFFEHKTYKKLSSSAKLLYAYYWNEYIYPSQPLRVDDDGRPVIRDNWKETKTILGLHSSTANTARRELLAAGLIRLSNRENHLLIMRDVIRKQPPPQKVTLLEPIKQLETE